MSAFEENPNLTPEDLARLEEQTGSGSARSTNAIWPGPGASLWATGATAMPRDQPVLTEIGERLPNTLQLMSVVALIVTLLIAIPIGILSALKQYSLFDHVATFWPLWGRRFPSSGLVLS